MDWQSIKQKFTQLKGRLAGHARDYRAKFFSHGQQEAPERDVTAI
jgi:predicted translin family RNA/ssDNA-binding protein